LHGAPPHPRIAGAGPQTTLAVEFAGAGPQTTLAVEWFRIGVRIIDAVLRFAACSTQFWADRMQHILLLRLIY
jgi:hypothetical protein